MSHQIASLIIIATWVALLVSLLFSRNFVKRRFLESASIIHIPDTSDKDIKPGSAWSKIGALFVFAANIAAFALVFAAAVSPSAVQRLDWMSVDLPTWVNVLGSMLFALDAVWGLLALLFNPNYTPMFQPMKKQFLLAKRGPYAVVRHPRYAAEVWLNVILFMFTGIWLPLLGALGWIAMYHQARAEEETLTTLAGEEYVKYRKRTGMFFRDSKESAEMNLEKIETLFRWLGGLTAWATLGVVLYGIWRGTHRPVGRTSGRVADWQHSPLFYLFSTALFLGVSVALWRPLPLVLSTQAQTWMLALGTIVYFPGIGFVLWGRLALGKMYFVSTGFGAQLYADHRLVTHGPFAIVRHPMYLGLIAAAFGSLLIYQTWTTALYAFFAPFILRRARREEQALAAEFGEEWQTYAARVPMFLPRWKKKLKESSQ